MHTDFQRFKNRNSEFTLFEAPPREKCWNYFLFTDFCDLSIPWKVDANFVPLFLCVVGKLCANFAGHLSRGSWKQFTFQLATFRYALCRSFELPGPCSHLWCGHASVSEVCKTKKGPPLEGTVCGKNKVFFFFLLVFYVNFWCVNLNLGQFLFFQWCLNGYCESMERKRSGLDRLINKPRHGGWSSWTSWGKCSRSCGVGVRFRFRQCNEPTWA